MNHKYIVNPIRLVAFATKVQATFSELDHGLFQCSTNHIAKLTTFEDTESQCYDATQKLTWSQGSAFEQLQEFPW